MRDRWRRVTRHAFGAGVVAVLLLIGASCGNGAPPPGADGNGTGMPPPGTGCATPNDGCPCSQPGQVVKCGQVKRNFGTYVDCSIGNRTCVGTTWGACIGNTISTKYVRSGAIHTLGLGTSVSCGNICDPYCNDFQDDAGGLDAGPGLTVTDAGLTIRSGLEAGADAGACKALQCNLAVCPAGSPTRITGKVFDPAGAEPVYNAIVYVPNFASGTALKPFTAGVGCDTCATLIKDPVLASTLTAPDGSFTLTVPTGVNFDVVVQSGRWRRRVNGLNIAAANKCTATAKMDGTFRFPASQAEGDIPLIALATGAGDALECLLMAMGVATTEFTAPSGSGRIHMYTQPTSAGATLAGGTPSADTNLWDTAAHLDRYQAVLMPCDNASPPRAGKTAAETQRMIDYTAVGGRLFASHWSAHDWIEGAAATITAPATATFASPVNWQDYDSPGFDYNRDRGPPNTGGATSTDDIITQVNQGFQKGSDFASWIVNVAANAQPPAPATQGQPARAPPYAPPYPPGTILSYPLPRGYFSQFNWRHMVGSVNSTATAWLTGDSRTTYTTLPAASLNVGPPGPVVQLLTFNTPVGAPAASQCGRVVFPVMHVSETSAGTFPGECAAGPLTPSEKVLEFMVFDATSCLLSDLVSPTPPMPPYPNDQTFARDFQAVCPTGTAPVWHVFDREDTMPLDSKIVFSVQTAATQATLGAATSLPLSTDQGPLDQSAAYVGTDVNTVLQAAVPSQPSGLWLRVTIDLVPSSDGTQAPTLFNWRQSYDCKPSE